MMGPAPSIYGSGAGVVVQARRRRRVALLTVRIGLLRPRDWPVSSLFPRLIIRDRMSSLSSKTYSSIWTRLAAGRSRIRVCEVLHHKV